MGFQIIIGDGWRLISADAESGLMERNINHLF
jgi:hypothetical protein